MKTFTILKVGYSSGVYGCSNEYFTCIYSSTPRQRKLYNGGLHSFSFKGLYGVESRIEEAMKEKVFTFSYTPSQYGKITGQDKYWIGFKGETEAIKYIKGGFKND